MEVEKEFPYDTVTYKWGEIKQCLGEFNMKIPAHLTSKNEDDAILFVIYPGRMRQLFLASNLLCITLDKDQNPINAFFFEPQADPSKSKIGSNGDDKKKVDNDNDEDLNMEKEDQNTEMKEKTKETVIMKEEKKEEEEEEKGKEITRSYPKKISRTNVKRTSSFKIIPPNRVFRRSYIVDPRVVLIDCKKSVVEMKAVQSITMSLATQKIFAKAERTASRIVQPDTASLARRVLNLLQLEFVKQKDYSYKWKSGKIAIPFELFIKLTIKAREVVEAEPSFLELSSPIYVFGDIHGNYTDLMRFSKMLGMFKAPRAMPARYLFLGDYVDRGKYSVEVIAYLLAMKVLYPKRIFLLRGNHELQTTNCSYQNYGERCFHGMCTKAYGEEDGNNVWWSVQYVFRNLPIAASIDKSIFCVHGGIPRFIETNPDEDVVKKMAEIKKPWDTEFNVKLSEFLSNKENQLVFDLLWSDPAIDPIAKDEDYNDEEGEKERFPKGFGRSERGPGSCVFSQEALKKFYEKTGFTHIIRAHEAVSVKH